MCISVTKFYTNGMLEAPWGLQQLFAVPREFRGFSGFFPDFFGIFLKILKNKSWKMGHKIPEIFGYFRVFRDPNRDFSKNLTMYKSIYIYKIFMIYKMYNFIYIIHKLYITITIHCYTYTITLCIHTGILVRTSLLTFECYKL